MAILEKKPSQLFVGLLFIFYRVSLDLNYVYVEVGFSYQNFFENNLTLLSYGVSWAIFFGFLPLILNLFKGNYLSNNVLVLLSIFSMMPQISIMGFRPDYPLSFFMSMGSYWLVFFATYYLSKPILIKYDAGYVAKKIPHIIFFVMVSTVVVYSALMTGLRFHFDLLDVYDIRLEARSFPVYFPFNYIMAAADNILACFAVLFLHKRQHFLFLGTLIVIWINFSITGSKQLLFIPICGIASYYIVKSPKHKYLYVVGALMLSFLAYIEINLDRNEIFTYLFTYRVLFLPTELHFSYFDFFQVNEFDFYRQSVLRAFFDSPYEIGVQFLIGEHAIGDISARANNGLYSDAFMNLGYLGVFIYPIIIVMILRLFDGVALRFDTRIWGLIAFYISTVLIGMTLSSSLINSGLLLLLVILYLFGREKNSSCKIYQK